MSMTEDGFDLQAFARRTQAVREFRHERPDGVVFVCRYPSRFERLAIDTRHADDNAAKVRAVVLASVILWTGVTVAHALPEAKNGGDVLPFGPDTLALLFDEQTEWLIDLWQDIKTRIAERDRRIEDALKNSASASVSNGGALAPVH